MFNIKLILGSIAIIVALVGYVPYFRDIFIGRTKPHVYSWLIWSILMGIGFFGQILNKGGTGAWVTGISALISVFIFLLALKKGEKNITLLDKLSLIGAFIAMGLWYLTNNPLSAIILIMIIDALGFFPTFRKSYHKPNEETMFTYFTSGLKFAIALFALESYSLITYLYPLYLVLANWSFVGMIIIRRIQFNK